MSQKEKTLDEFVRGTNSSPSLLRVMLDLVSDPSLICEVGSAIAVFLHAKSNEAGVKAMWCRNEGCAVRIHEYCLGKLFAKRKVERACPKCGTQWQYTGPKSEDDEPDCTTQSQPKVGSKRKKLRNRTGDGDIIESSSQGSSNGRNMRRSTRTSSRLH